MTEQNLAAMFKDIAKQLRDYCEELIALVPEAGEHCAPLDELVEYLKRQSRALEDKVAVPVP